jgi:hypothetical protein
MLGSLGIRGSGRFLKMKAFFQIPVSYRRFNREHPKVLRN